MLKKCERRVKFIVKTTIRKTENIVILDKMGRICYDYLVKLFIMGFAGDNA